MPFSTLDFTCGPSACVGKNSKATSAFRDLQKQLNRLGARLVVDGAIGNNTVSAAKTIMQNDALTKEALAMMADVYAASLSKVPVSGIIELPGSSPSVPVAPPSTGWGWAALAGLGLLVGVGAILYAVR